MANIVWGINNVGWNADAVALADGSVVDGSLNNVISGPRSSYARFLARTATIHVLEYRVDNYTTTPTKFLEASHLFLGRWDWTTNHQYASDQVRLRVAHYNNGAYTNYFDYNQVGDTSWTMLGPYSQDMVINLNSGAVEVDTMFRLTFSHGSGSTSWGIRQGAVYWSNPWDPGRGPDLEPQPQWTPLDRDAVFQAPRSSRPYEVEAEITLTWKSITDAKRDELYTYYGGGDCILNWPFFLYDESQTLWNHKLEHVILADYQWTKNFSDGDGLNDLACKFYRLRHYP